MNIINKLQQMADDDDRRMEIIDSLFNVLMECTNKDSAQPAIDAGVFISVEELADKVRNKIFPVNVIVRSPANKFQILLKDSWEKTHEQIKQRAIYRLVVDGAGQSTTSDDIVHIPKGSLVKIHSFGENYSIDSIITMDGSAIATVDEKTELEKVYLENLGERN